MGTQDEPPPQAHLPPMRGWRLWMTLSALFLGLLLSALETTIISTALVPIASELGDYSRSNWIVVSYLLTYTGFLNIYARCSDIFGRKSSYLTALIIFSAFSLGCGVVETIEQLIICRAFQGIGGAGIYSMAMATMAEITPVEVVGSVTGLMSSIFAVSSILGPVLGGAITSNTTWRWVFYLNIPGGILAMLIAAWTFPSNHGPLPITMASLNRLDWPGILLCLSGSTFLLVGLELGGVEYAWDGSLIISSLVLSGVSWIGFAAWEFCLAWMTPGYFRVALPVFPIWLTRCRVVVAAFICAFLTGFPFMTLTVYLPQRFQIQNGLSPVDSGIRMLPLLLVSAFGVGLGGVVNSKKNVSFYTLMVALSLQLIGLGLMSTLPSTGTLLASQYGYQSTIGLGFGLCLTSLVIISRLEVGSADLAVTMGTITQVRVLGGTIGVAIGQLLTNHILNRDLPGVLSDAERTALMRSVASMAALSPEKQAAVRRIYGGAFNMQTKLVLYITAACWVSALGTFKRRPVDFEEVDELQPHRQGHDHQLETVAAQREHEG